MFKAQHPCGYIGPLIRERPESNGGQDFLFSSVVSTISASSCQRKLYWGSARSYLNEAVVKLSDALIGLPEVQEVMGHAQHTRAIEPFQ